jgi:DDE superfamily endonuclease
VLAARAGDLHGALRRVAADGCSHVIPDGTLVDRDRLTETRLSVTGETIDARYAGKHRDLGATIPAVRRPDRLPIRTSAAMPGHLHDLTCAQQQGVTAARDYSAAELDLPALADSGHDGAGQGIKTPVRQATDGRRLAAADRADNRLPRGLRRHGERGFAILAGRWKTLRHGSAGPGRIGDIVAAALHPTHFGYKYLPESR